MRLFRRAKEQREPASVPLRIDYGSGREWPDFEAALEAYKNPLVALAVDNIVGHVLAGGFYFRSENRQAAEKITRWAERIGLRGLLFDVIKELILTGNSFLKPIGRGESLELTRIPLSWIRPRFDFVIDENARVRVTNYYLAIRAGTHYEERALPANEVIHLAWNVLDPSRPWGYGIAYQLISRQRDWNGREVPSVLEAEASLRRNLVLYLYRAIPKRLIHIDASAQDLQTRFAPELAAALNEPTVDYITNTPFTVTELKPNELNFSYYTIVENVLISALRSPIVKLFTTPGFTEASAREATRLYENYIDALREYIEHMLETHVFPRVTNEARVELHWGQPERPDLRFADILAASRADAHNPALITREEARTILRELGWILTDDGAEEAFRSGRIVDTLHDVQIYLVPPDDIDRNTMRYYTIDSEKGIRLATALVKSLQRRQPVLLIFDKIVYKWDVAKAKQYYFDVFPTIYEQHGMLFI